MARAFTPSRSMIYGAPEREALVDIGGTVMGALTNWGEEKLQADYMEQMSAGSVALSRERNALFGRMTTEKAKSPDDWVPTFQKGKEQIRNKILGGIRQPRARRMMQLKMEEEFADWEAKLGNASIQQKAANIQTNYEVWREGVKTESNDYSGPMAMDLLMGNVKDVLESVDQAHNARGLAAHPDVATPEAADLEKRTLVRGLVEDYAVQTALATGDESVIDNINRITEAIFGDTGKPVFGPEEKAKAKARYKAASNAAQAEVKAEKGARADAFEMAATNDILAGKYTFTDALGRTMNWLDAIHANLDISASTKRTLDEKYNARVNAQNKGKSYTPNEIIKARVEILSETDRKKQFDLLFNHAAGLGNKETERLRGLISDPAKNYSNVASDLNTKVEAIRNVKLQAATDPKDKEGIETKLLWLQDQILWQLDENPDWTDKERKEAVDSGLAIVMEETAKDTIGWWKKMWQGDLVPKGRQTYGMWAPQTPRAPADEKSPTGLEEFWPTMNPEERATVTRALARGEPLNRIIEMAKRKP